MTPTTVKNRPARDSYKVMKRRSQPDFTCTCGRVVVGHLAKASHRRACDGTWLSWQEAYDQRDKTYRESLVRLMPRQSERVYFSDIQVLCECRHLHGCHYEHQPAVDTKGNLPTLFDTRRPVQGCLHCACKQLTMLERHMPRSIGLDSEIG